MSHPSVHHCELTIEKLVNGGDGLARSGEEAARRRVIFVPFTLPGERVEVALPPPGGSAPLLRVLEPSPDRIEPRCEYFGRCGGCQWQHIRPQRQLELKREILLETLARLGGVAWSGALGVHAADPWGYRNRVQLHRSPPGAWGYFRLHSHEVLPVTHCPIASPRLNQAIAPAARLADPANAAEMEFVADGADHHLLPGPPLEYRLAGNVFRVSQGSFFQVNRYLAGELLECVTAGPGGDLALDLFSGVGLFALPLARNFARVEAVELHKSSFRDLEHNAQPFPNLRALRASALDFLRHRAPTPVDLLVADPPRAGLGRELTAAIVKHAPPRLHLVSCDPATLARDLRDLLAGGYQLVSLDLFDLFPQTHHIETVARLHTNALPQ